MLLIPKSLHRSYPPCLWQWARIALFAGLACIGLAPATLAQGPDINLPVFTSAIDITGVKAQIHAVAPDRDTGKRVDIALPAGLLGPKMNQILSTPLSSSFDQYWSSTIDPSTGKTARDQACTGQEGILAQVQDGAKRIGSGFNAYDIRCDLAPTGKLYFKQVGVSLYLGYLLTNNHVGFNVTTPATCHVGRGTLLCPNDPRFEVTFAVELVVVAHVPGICTLNVSNGEVDISDVYIDSGNASAAVGKFADDFILGHNITAAQRAIESTVKSVPLPLDSSFQELRQSDACSGKSAASHLLQTFREFEVELKSHQGLVFTLEHPAIAPPVLRIPDPADSTAVVPSQPTFTKPTISINTPVVAAGSTVQISGRNFPRNIDYSKSLPITILHGGIGTGSIILGGPCTAGGTDLRFGPSNNTPNVQRLPAGAQGPCADQYSASGLTPETAYQFSARDCDAVTCSLWSPIVKVTTGKAPSASTGLFHGRAILVMDGRTNLGAAFITPEGTFARDSVVPASIAPGSHTILAGASGASAELTLTVTVSNPGGSNASMIVVGVLNGESGCPPHPIGSTATGASFMLFGTGFTPGRVFVYLDTPTGLLLGSPVAQPNGTFCESMSGVPASLAGNRNLIAVENGQTKAQTPMKFIDTSGPH